MAASPHPERALTQWRSLRRSRHLARAPRYVFLATLVLLCALGLRALISPPATAQQAPSVAQADMPSEDFALQFARAYLTYDAAHPEARAKALAPYLGQTLDQGAGLEATRGSQHVLWAEIASDQPALAGGRLLTVAAAVSNQRLPLYLAVDVRHPHGGSLELLGYPALVGAPAIASSSSPPPRAAVEDPELHEVAERVLRNYLALAAPDLKADLAPAAEVTLPTRRLQLTELSCLEWLDGPGSGAVLATVSASDPGGTTYTLTYELGIAYRDRPYVDFIEVVPTAS
jgi:hypothetical protein